MDSCGVNDPFETFHYPYVWLKIQLQEIPVFADPVIVISYMSTSKTK